MGPCVMFSKVVHIMGGWDLVSWLGAFLIDTVCRTDSTSLSNTVGRSFSARLLAARLRAAPPLSNPRTLTACKSARIQ